jgi:hypothetical protein
MWFFAETTMKSDRNNTKENLATKSLRLHMEDLMDDTDGKIEVEAYCQWLDALERGDDEELIDKFLMGELTEEDIVTNKKGERPVLKPSGGGVLGCFTRFSNIKGHFDATQEVLMEFGVLSQKAITSIARASRLIDLLRFANLNCHAQSYTVSESDHKIRDSESDKQDFQNLLCSEVHCAWKFLKEKHVKPFYFHFGNVLHMVQDLACHQGMSNPEHAYLDKGKDHRGESLSPDKSKKRYEVSKLASVFIIDKIFIEEIKLSKDLLNGYPLVKWSEYQTVRAVIKVVKEGIRFSLNPLKEWREEYIARWFEWSEAQSPEKNFEQMKPIIIDCLNLRQLNHLSSIEQVI